MAQASQPNTVNVEVKSGSKFPWGCLIGVLLVVMGIVGFVFISILVLASVGDVDAVYDSSDVQENVIKEGEDSDKIAVIPVKGIIAMEYQESNLFSTAIASPQKIEPMLEKALKDDDVKAIVLDMDTPGGEVLASDLIYRKVKELNTAKPVVVWMGNQGTSGGYYIAAGASEIVAHPYTITGSIGVIAQFRNIDGLYDKLGIQTKTYKSADFKDNAKIWEGGSTELDKIYQDLIDETYDGFVDVVVEGRGIDRAIVLELADGRIYSGLQAESNGLVDSTGLREDAIERSAQLASLADPDIVEYSSMEDFWSSFGLMQNKLLNGFGLTSLVPQSLSEPGIYVYYMAEPVGANH